MEHFELDQLGELSEYVGCKIQHNREEGWMRLTQPVIVQSFEDEFDLTAHTTTKTPAAPGEVLEEGDDEHRLPPNEHKDYRKAVGKLLHVTKLTRPEISNATRELSRFGHAPTTAHYNAMLRCMKYCVDTKERGILLKPDAKWDGSKDFKFRIHGASDSDFAKCKKTRRSVSGYAAFLNNAPYVRKSTMQAFVTTSVTEAECVAATSCIQEMLFGMRWLEAIGLQVEKPMTLWMDNKGGVDLFNSWSINGRTRSIAVRLAFVRELKEQGVIAVKWFPTDQNYTDFFTKNVDGNSFNEQAKVYCGPTDG